MERSDPDAVYAALRAADPDVMDRDELAELTRQIAAHKAWCEALQVRTTRRQRQLANEGRSESPRDILTHHGGQSAKDARTIDERERVCSTLPGFEDALADGTVAAGHVDAIAAATRNLDEPSLAAFNAHAIGLLANATTTGVDAFEQQCRDLARLIAATNNPGSDADELDRQRQMSRVKRWTDPETGMRHTRITLDPVRDAQLWAAIDQARRRLRSAAGPGTLNWEQLQVDAVIAAVNEAGSATGGVLVLIDETTMRDRLHEHTVCELADGTPVPVEACEIHHVNPYEHGGPTDLSNLLPLCLTAGHHQQVHQGGWTLTIRPDRAITLTRPDGTIWYAGATADRAPAGVAPQREVA